jgi:hypothetical protein
MSQLPPSQAPPQYSPDGKWWWDGERWLAVSDETPPARYPAAPPAPPVPERRAVPWLPILAVAVAFVVAVGALTGAFFAGRQILSSRPGATPSPSPSPQPAPATRYPYRYLDGVKVSSLTASLRSQGLQCSGPESLSNLGLRLWRCNKSDGATSYGVVIQALDDAHVHLVDATAIGATARPTPDMAQGFLRPLATTPFTSRPDLANQASTWVSTNLGSPAQTSIGSVDYRTQASDTVDFLELDAGFIR